MRLAVAFSVIAILLGSIGCSSRDPLERIVSAPTPSRFATWRAHVASDSGVAMRNRIEAALQEIRLSVMGERELKRAMGERVTGGAEEIDEVVRQRVDGRALREMLQLGYELRVRRLREELAGLEDAMGKNAQLVTKPGDLESRHHLDGLRDRQLVRVEQYRADLSAAEQELAPLLARTGRRLIAPVTDLPAPVKKTTRRETEDLSRIHSEETADGR